MDKLEKAPLMELYTEIALAFMNEQGPRNFHPLAISNTYVSEKGEYEGQFNLSGCMYSTYFVLSSEFGLDLALTADTVSPEKLFVFAGVYISPEKVKDIIDACTSGTTTTTIQGFAFVARAGRHTEVTITIETVRKGRAVYVKTVAFGIPNEDAAYMISLYKMHQKQTRTHYNEGSHRCGNI
jgi:hypothetical protein